MEDLLRKMTGAKVDVICTNGAAIRGEVSDVSGGLLTLIGEDGQKGYVSTERISAVWEVRDAQAKPGFLS